MALKKNSIVPDFTAALDDGETVTLSKVQSKFIVLYFYPKDNTPGCTAQACGIRNSMPELEKLDAKVFGIGKGNKNSHKKFKSLFSLNFPLILDENLEISKLYDVLEERSMFGKKYMGIQRTTYILDKDLKVLEVMESVNPLTHEFSLLQQLKAL